MERVLSCVVGASSVRDIGRSRGQAHLARCNDAGIATFIHLNGPPGVGKSTVARGLVARRALALDLDVDSLRVRLGRWEERPESKQMARDLAFDLAGRHLADGQDVVMPQLVVRSDVVDEIADIAARAGAQFEEVILIARRDELIERLERSRGSDSSHPRDQFSVEELVTHVEHALNALAAIASQRPLTRIVDVAGMSPVEAVAHIASVLGWNEGTGVC